MYEYMSEYAGMHVLEEHTNITASETKSISGVFMMTKWLEAVMTSSAGQSRR